MEAVMPLEVENPPLRVLVDSEFRRGGMVKS
jgi:tartrate dehydratase beta subunit/fumarate hydratase class I family protein